jgi:hypothetical protein
VHVSIDNYSIEQFILIPKECFVNDRYLLVKAAFFHISNWFFGSKRVSLTPSEWLLEMNVSLRVNELNKISTFKLNYGSKSDRQSFVKKSFSLLLLIKVKKKF